MKKYIAMLLVVVMVLGMTACGSGSTADTPATANDAPVVSASEGKTIAEIKNWKIGYLDEDSADAGQTLPTIDNIVWTIEALGCTPVGVVPASNAPEDLITAVENLINQGCDAITMRNLIHMNGLTATVIDMCEEAGVYCSFFNTKIAEDSDAWTAAHESEYFVSTHYNENSEAGYKAVEILATEGVTKICVFGQPVSNLTGGERYSGVEQACKDLGVEILTFTADLNLFNAEGGATVAENFLNAYPDVEGIVITGGTGLLLPGYAPVVEGTGVKTAGIDFGEVMGEHLKSGLLSGMVGGHVAGGAYSVIMLVNKLNGTPLMDGPAFIKDLFLDVTPENVDDLNTCYFHKQFYTDEQLQHCVVAFNPDATIDDLYNLINCYTIKDLMKQYS